MPGLRFAISSRTSYISFVKKKKKKNVLADVSIIAIIVYSLIFLFFFFFFPLLHLQTTLQTVFVSYRISVALRRKKNLRLASTFSEPSGGTCVLKCFALLVYSRVVKRAVPQTCRQPACPKLGGCPSRRIRPPPK